MICVSCEARCQLTKSGLCRECRSIAHRPARPRHAGPMAQRWLAPEYRELRRRRGLNVEQAVAKSEHIFATLRMFLPADVIVDNGLDNPYMANHARRTLVAQILSDAVKRGESAARKPVQSARPNSTRKAVAA